MDIAERIAELERLVAIMDRRGEEAASLRQELAWLRELVELRGNDLGALLARVPGEWELTVSVMHSGQYWAIWTMGEQRHGGEAESWDGAIRAATLQLLGEEPPPKPGLTCQEYAAEYLRGRHG